MALTVGRDEGPELSPKREKPTHCTAQLDVRTPFVAIDLAAAATVCDDEGVQRYGFRTSLSAYLCQLMFNA